MEKYTVDYSEMDHFKGIRVLVEHLEEGLSPDHWWIIWDNFRHRRMSKYKNSFPAKMYTIKEIRPIISKLQNPQQLNLEGCKSIDVELAGLDIKHVSII
ncbi:hypothetical protein [Sphingobacterium thalpophilum]|uniref:hypothetical protein n=1 Tax=Sphingobacterium thalpophilum TaxID=259 RepID=UPI003D99BD29